MGEIGGTHGHRATFARGWRKVCDTAFVPSPQPWHFAPEPGAAAQISKSAAG